MSITVNKNTTQPGMVTDGKTGAQSIRFIPAPRVYVKSVDASPAPVLAKSNGVTPSGWTDLGSVLGAAKVNYTTKTNEVRTGLDEILRVTYLGQKAATIEFTLGQLDDVVLEKITGLTASLITSGSIVSYQVGQVDMNQMAILLVSQNKLDEKEFQFYNPNAYLAFSFEESSDALGLKVTATCPPFTAPGNTLEGLFSVVVFK